MPKKIEREGFELKVRFCNCSKKFLAKARTGTRDRWVHRKPSKVCTKKWYIHDEVCGLTKKELATVIVGLFSLEKRQQKSVISEVYYVISGTTAYSKRKRKCAEAEFECKTCCLRSTSPNH